jgi:DNA-binding response OmpR family regulator
MHNKDRRTILVVDEEVEALGVLEKVLQRAGFDVVGLNDAKAAVEEARSRAFDAIVLDLKLPGKSGAEAAWEIRKRNPSVPLIAYSGHLESWDREDLADLGFNEFIPKPSEAKVILETLRKVTRA